jgi:ABC-type multidrug transport system permease subunit
MANVFDSKLARLLVGRWPLMLAPLFFGYALLIQPPYVFGEIATRALWAICAAVMAVAGLHPSRDLSVLAMSLSVFAVTGRAYALIVMSSHLTAEWRWSGSFVWSIVGVLIIVMTVATEAIRASDRGRQKAERHVAGESGAVRS